MSGDSVQHHHLHPAVSVVMGIPSVRREVHSYLTDTLHSLISELSPQEKEDSVIVVLIAEVSDAGMWYGGGGRHWRDPSPAFPGLLTGSSHPPSLRASPA